MRLTPEPRFTGGAPSTEANRRTTGLHLHGTGEVEPGDSSTPVTLAEVALRGHTTWIGASTDVGSGATCSTRSRGSPPTRYSDGSRGSVLSELGASSS